MGKHFNKTIKEYRHKLKPVGYDPETRAYESEVEYLPDFMGVLEGFIKIREDLQEIVAEKREDKELREIYKQTRNLLNKYRTHVRKNYPQEYDSINEEGSHSVSGTGEQYSTPKAFRKNEKVRVKKNN